ncbi:MAG: phospho-sugar mutase [Oscillospiraceae bacterium]|nr:phospho-sugar mutase [Oscillospiraceae bacterium]
MTDFELEFGTGGLRGILGEGPGRMNLVTVGRAAQGVAEWAQSGSAVIAYDTRAMSREFAEHTARVLSGNGLRVWLFPRPVPTPTLSFAVRRLKADCGVCITASHNPKEYNGFKVYGRDGGQITLADADAIRKKISGLVGSVKIADPDGASLEKTAQNVPDELVARYLAEVEKCRVTDIPCDVKIAYTPLNGAGRECVELTLRRMGASVVTVPEQAEPDGNFPTCPLPNPEEESALELGKALCLKENCDLLLATDPDCDRVGVAVNHHGEMSRLTGNEVGVLLLEFLAKARNAGNNGGSRPVAVKTVVTTPMADAICEAYGIELRNVLTGFKYIGEQIGLLEQNGEESRFLFGFEESCGYLSGTHARDKDGVNAALLITEMAADYKKRGLTLRDGMESLYERYGRWATKLSSMSASGLAAEALRQNPPKEVAGYPVLAVTDYLGGVRGLPPADVLEYTLSVGKILVRPSGTEPKVKVYYLLRGVDVEEIDADFQRLYLGRDTP